MAKPLQRSRQHSGGWASWITVLAVCAAAVLALSVEQAPAALFKKRPREKVLARYRGYEVRLQPRGPGQPLPRVYLRKIPPKPVSLLGLAGGVEGSLDRDLLGFPFTTKNTASVQLGFPVLSGRFKLGVEDPPTGADADEAQRAVEASYEQLAPGLGDVAVKVRSTGEWGVSFARQVEDLGRLHGTINSQLNWGFDLDTVYPPVRGLVPSVTYGATQDGMRARAKLDGFLTNGVHGSYSVQNLPGKYSPADFVHDAKLTVASSSRKHVLEADATYNRKYPMGPLRGSLAYTTRIKPVTLEASVDMDRYRLKARTPHGHLAAATARVPVDGVRPSELELRVGKVTAGAQFGGKKPRMRIDVGV